MNGDLINNKITDRKIWMKKILSKSKSFSPFTSPKPWHAKYFCFMLILTFTILAIRNNPINFEEVKKFSSDKKNRVCESFVHI